MAVVPALMVKAVVGVDKLGTTYTIEALLSNAVAGFAGVRVTIGAFKNARLFASVIVTITALAPAVPAPVVIVIVPSVLVPLTVIDGEVPAPVPATAVGVPEFPYMPPMNVVSHEKVTFPENFLAPASV